MPLNDEDLDEFRDHLGRLKQLWAEGGRMIENLRSGLAGDIPLTAAQKTAIRARYDDWKARLQTWFGGLP